MSTTNVPGGSETGFDYQAALPAIEQLISNGKYTQVFFDARDVLNQPWDEKDLLARMQFVETVIGKLPANESNGPIANSLREAAQKKYAPPPKPDSPAALALMRLHMMHLIKSSMPPGSGGKSCLLNEIK